MNLIGSSQITDASRLVVWSVILNLYPLYHWHGMVDIELSCVSALWYGTTIVFC